jgi:hypothetical protein
MQKFPFVAALFVIIFYGVVLLAIGTVQLIFY